MSTSPFAFVLVTSFDTTDSANPTHPSLLRQREEVCSRGRGGGCRGNRCLLSVFSHSFVSLFPSNFFRCEPSAHFSTELSPFSPHSHTCSHSCAAGAPHKDVFTALIHVGWKFSYLFPKLLKETLKNHSKFEYILATNPALLCFYLLISTYSPETSSFPHYPHPLPLNIIPLPTYRSPLHRICWFQRDWPRQEIPSLTATLCHLCLMQHLLNNPCKTSISETEVEQTECVSKSPRLLLSRM